MSALLGLGAAHAADQRVRAPRVAELDPGAPRGLAAVRLVGCAVVACADAGDFLPFQPAAGDIDPVDRVVVDDTVLQLVEYRAWYPAELHVVHVRDRHDLADGALLDQQGGDPPGRRPAAILVDRDLETTAPRLYHYRSRLGQIQRERLLGQDVLAGLERAVHQRDALIRMGGD